MRGIANVEDAQARVQERAGDDLGVDLSRRGAVVGAVPQRLLGQRIRIAAGLLVDVAHVHLEPDVGLHRRVGRVGDVDQPRRTDLVVHGRGIEAERELVELE